MLVIEHTTILADVFKCFIHTAVFDVLKIRSQSAFLTSKRSISISFIPNPIAYAEAIIARFFEE